MAKFFNPNWNAINKAFQNDDERKEIRAELSALTKKIDQKFHELFIQREQQKKIDAVNKLKGLSNGCVVFYTGRSIDIPYAKQGIKVKDGRTRMVVEVDGKRWAVHYECLSADEPTQDQRRSRIVENRIVNLFNERR